MMPKEETVGFKPIDMFAEDKFNAIKVDEILNWEKNIELRPIGQTPTTYTREDGVSVKDAMATTSNVGVVALAIRKTFAFVTTTNSSLYDLRFSFETFRTDTQTALQKIRDNVLNKFNEVSDSIKQLTDVVSTNKSDTDKALKEVANTIVTTASTTLEKASKYTDIVASRVAQDAVTAVTWVDAEVQQNFKNFVEYTKTDWEFSVAISKKAESAQNTADGAVEIANGAIQAIEGTQVIVNSIKEEAEQIARDLSISKLKFNGYVNMNGAELMTSVMQAYTNDEGMTFYVPVIINDKDDELKAKIQKEAKDFA